MFSEVPTMTNTNVNQDICSGTMTDEIVFSSTYPANTSYTWTGISPTNNITGVIPTGNTSTIPPIQLTLTSGATGTVAYTVIPYLVEDCQYAPMLFTIKVNESPSILTQPIGADRKSV